MPGIMVPDGYLLVFNNRLTLLYGYGHGGVVTFPITFNTVFNGVAMWVYSKGAYRSLGNLTNSTIGLAGGADMDFYCQVIGII